MMETISGEPLLPFSYAKRHEVLIDQDANSAFTLIYTSLPPITVLSEIRRLLHTDFSAKRVTASDFNKRLVAVYQNNNSRTLERVSEIGSEMDLTSLMEAIPDASDLLDQVDDAPVIRLINGIIAEAIGQDASDIHIAPYEKRLAIRFRVDGVLRDIVEPRRELAQLIVSRIKVMAKMDIAEKRVPQDGRITTRLGGREIDMRVSTMPSIYGERVVLRLLDKQVGQLSLEKLGLEQDHRIEFQRLLKLPHGIVLITGPTGSGKTTTLYAGLSYINDATRNILTAEDPIEYQLEGIGQTQVNPKTGMTFAKSLRSMLRQDPDIVMVGEIRDLETVQTAIQASLTGHLVLSTLHTNTAIGAIMRLLDMGVESFLIASTLSAVAAQRLVRVLCPACKVAHHPTEYECKLLSLPANSTDQIYRPREFGCEQCHYQGYRGRTGIYELITINNELKQLIHDKASEKELIAVARKTNVSIRADGYKKIISGITSIEEVLRVSTEF